NQRRPFFLTPVENRLFPDRRDQAQYITSTGCRSERGRMGQTAIIIRPATAHDYPFIYSLSSRLVMVAELPGRSEAELQTFQDRHMQAALAKPDAKAATLVAAMPSGPVLGFIHLQQAPDPVTDAPAGYVSMLAVVPEAEGQGIARQLMAAAES